MNILSELNTDAAYRVTPEQAESLSQQEQRFFAEYCYLEIIPQYNSIKKDYGLEVLYSAKMIGADKAFPFFKGVDDPATDSEGYALGQDWPFNLPLHPAVDEMYKTKEDKVYYETVTSTVNGVEYLFGYTPIMRDGDIRCHICCSYVMTARIVRDLRAIEWVNIFIMIAASGLLLLLLYSTVLKNLSFVQRTVREYCATKDSRAVVDSLKQVTTMNEVGQLAEDFSEMAVELDRYTGEMVQLTAERERIGTELSLATSIQTGMLPNLFPAFPDRTEFDIYASMDPAKEVGGDFYDFFLIDDDHLALVIADVSGKGVPASLFMMSTKILINDHALMGGTPAEILRRVNGLVCANNEADMFVTVWLGILELSTGKLTAANVGHEYPMLKTDGKFEILKDKHGMPIGAFEMSKYRDYELTLKKGDKLFVYTDGVAEAADADNQFFGAERTLEVLNAAPDASPKEMLTNVRQAVDRFVKDAPQFDDLTMLGLTYFGK